MINKVKLVTGFLILLCGIARADSQWLVTPEEVSKESAWVEEHPSSQHFAAQVPKPGSPDIDLLKPASLDTPLKTPFPIYLVFKAKDGATIKPDSFKVLYGFLKLDITSRIASHAKVGPNGIEVESAEIPAGKHHLVARVTDDRGRQGETDFDFTVK